MLEQSAIAHYLLSLGLVKPQEVVDGDLTILDVSRRNCVYLAATGAGTAYVVKQAMPSSAETLSHEAAVLRSLAADPEVAGLVPAVVHHDPEAARLVLRTPTGGRDWSDHHGTGRFPRIPARVLGRALAALHRVPPASIPEPPPGLDPLWGLSLPAPRREIVLELSAGARDLVVRLQANEAMCDRLNGLREVLSDGSFVHGDLRWDNCLAVAAPGSRRRTRVVLVDWELAGRGPAEHDVGAVLAEYLRLWVGSIPIVEPRDPGRLVVRASHPLADMQPAMHAFWSAYREACTTAPLLRRVVELAAVRLIQSAIERAQGFATPTAHVVTLLQLAENLLRDPERGGATLLGLRE
jgi:Ser/Thr protein kinase RdoA (MazF antagonist)